MRGCDCQPLKFANRLKFLMASPPLIVNGTEVRRYDPFGQEYKYNPKKILREDPTNKGNIVGSHPCWHVQTKRRPKSVESELSGGFSSYYSQSTAYVSIERIRSPSLQLFWAPRHCANAFATLYSGNRLLLLPAWKKDLEAEIVWLLSQHLIEI